MKFKKEYLARKEAENIKTEKQTNHNNSNKSSNSNNSSLLLNTNLSSTATSESNTSSSHKHQEEQSPFKKRRLNEKSETQQTSPPSSFNNNPSPESCSHIAPSDFEDWFAQYHSTTSSPAAPTNDSDDIIPPALKSMISPADAAYSKVLLEVYRRHNFAQFLYQVSKNSEPNVPSFLVHQLNVFLGFTSETMLPYDFHRLITEATPAPSNNSNPHSSSSDKSSTGHVVYPANSLIASWAKSPHYRPLYLTWDDSPLTCMPDDINLLKEGKEEAAWMRMLEQINDQTNNIIIIQSNRTCNIICFLFDFLNLISFLLLFFVHG